MNKASCTPNHGVGRCCSCLDLDCFRPLTELSRTPLIPFILFIMEGMEILQWLKDVDRMNSSFIVNLIYLSSELGTTKHDF